MVGNAEAAAASSGRVRGFQPQGQAQPSAGRGDCPGDIAAELRVHGRQMPAAGQPDQALARRAQQVEGGQGQRRGEQGVVPGVEQVKRAVQARRKAGVEQAGQEGQRIA